MTIDSVVEDIKTLKIQGASNIAKAALRAYAHAKNRSSAAKKLIKARPTEPMLRNLLKLATHQSPEQILGRLASDSDKLVMFGARKLGRCNSIYTHCHSATVLKIIKAIEPKVVYNTETRPRYQGRITATELASAGIKVEHSVDSAMASQIEKSEVILLGADALTKDGFYNKVGSLAICLLAREYSKPVYVCTHSLKFSEKEVEIEQRASSEVWEKPPRGVAILNPAFEFIPSAFIEGIICEKGVLSFNKFISEVK